MIGSGHLSRAAIASLFTMTSTVGLGMQVVAQSPASVLTQACGESFDVYSVPLSESQRCGFRLFPRQSTSKLSNGGMEYTYVVDGLRSVYRVPPPGTDLSQMTDSDIALYGLPERPKDATALTDWTAQMSHRHPVTPPSTLVERPADSAGISTSTTWSGYLATSSSSSAYSFAEAIYNEPGVYGTSCGNNSAVFWAGLGGWGTQNLAQAGTSINWGGGQHQAWYEILPNGAVSEPVFGHPGYAFYAEVNRIGGGFNFNLYDSYSGYGINFQVYGAGYDGRTADFVVERPILNGQRSLTNYVWVPFLDAYVNGTGPGHGVGSYSNTNVYMYNGSDLLAYNSSLTNSGKSFNNYWNSCS